MAMARVYSIEEKQPQDGESIICTVRGLGQLVYGNVVAGMVQGHGISRIRLWRQLSEKEKSNLARQGHPEFGPLPIEGNVAPGGNATMNKYRVHYGYDDGEPCGSTVVAAANAEEASREVASKLPNYLSVTDVAFAKEPKPVNEKAPF